LRAHVGGCRACEQTLAEIGRSLAAGRADAGVALPESFWDGQRRAIMAKLPRESGGFKMFRLWPAMAASVCAVLLACVLMWPAAAGDEDKLLNSILDRATASPSREWIDSVAGDPELRSIREVYAVGDAL
jgi:hypothetical protein